MLSGLFHKKPTPEEMVKKWKLEIRKEIRNLERNIDSITMEEKKVTRSIKELIKKGDKKSASILAKEMVRSKKAKERLYTSRATLNSVSMQLQQQLSMSKIAGTMAKSTQIMEMMNNLVKLPQLHASMMQMGQEMTKAGLLEEMMDEVFEDEELDDEANAEVDNIMMQLTNEVLNQGAKVPATKLPTGTVATTTSASAAKEKVGEDAGADDDDEDADLTARLNALRNG